MLSSVKGTRRTTSVPAGMRMPLETLMRLVTSTATGRCMPWNLLPGLRGRPVTVAVSASVWFRAASSPRSPAAAGPLLVAGPNLLHTEDEVRKVAEVFPSSTVLCGPSATVAATLGALDGRRDVHFAAHGHHEPGNFLFSRLDLADGPLMAYDIHQLDAVPAHVVLSSCDIGRNVVRTGNEMLGFTAALLYSGTSTVIAGVRRVPDDLSLQVMSMYHQMRALDVRPVAALAAATENGPPVPLVCFGCG
ncbi:CHAT domain-containing protein [Lentzea sp. PSKA42]|uniref:CHAT domain-containing protein n=2 Tax=Lentzea indica TaxID=2604800 RepID=A0ABX1FSN0_9PSEU|nr:CHAT domain-containing protein [Lentzea indica]